MKRSEIWLVNLDPTIGAEIKKTKPAIIVNNNALGKLPLKIIVPITDWKDNYDVALWMEKIIPDEQNNLSKVSCADCFQIRSVSQERLIKQTRNVSTEVLSNIEFALSKVLNIKSI